jgi:hypothetical protein
LTREIDQINSAAIRVSITVLGLGIYTVGYDQGQLFSPYKDKRPLIQSGCTNFITIWDKQLVFPAIERYYLDDICPFLILGSAFDCRDLFHVLHLWLMTKKCKRSSLKRAFKRDQTFSILFYKFALLVILSPGFCTAITGIGWACVTSSIRSHVWHTQLISSLQTVQVETGVRYVPQDLHWLVML